MANQRRAAARAGAGAAAGGRGAGNNILQFYTDDSPGLQIGPTTVLIASSPSWDPSSSCTSSESSARKNRREAHRVRGNRSARADAGAAEEGRPVTNRESSTINHNNNPGNATSGLRS
eukprot:CAMPEP_0197181330 /NCGR_PEP_ID=MMETSP1423-20130617/5652_1 /TAXON_ID=476441 /ORGANISM="Pseudo-nitzschia heimii, Strain UNC1101" /LENGTH=117 /DNA_ID=CAMNT_0042631565 /DNA_START=124 /DNA_END=479 /DNA_ORIENTATION=+